MPESVAQVRAIAAATGHAGRGEALAARITAAASPTRIPPVGALVWQGNGLVPGSGTLTDDLLKRAGFTNMSAKYGLRQWDVLPLEYLVADPPRVLLSTAPEGVQDDRMTGHPAVRRLAKHIIVAPYPTRLMNCGGPTIIAAMARLRQVRAKVAS